MFTAVSLSAGGRWCIDGHVTDAGTPMEGMLPNSRMVQATFDDVNAATAGYWKYPDTGKWDPTRNINEFVAAVPSWRAKGLLAATLNFQGGGPQPSGFANNQAWSNSAYNADGSLKSDYLDRMERAIRALDQNGMVAIVGLFYFGQDQRLADESAVKRAVNNVADWIVAKGFRNVVIEIDNEADLHYDHAILQPARVAELIDQVKARTGGKVLVSTSLSGGAIPPASVIATSDFILLHGNGQSATAITKMIQKVRARTSKAIVFNEDSTNLDNFHAAMKAGASWGYYDQGDAAGHGFQTPAVNWTINTPSKRAFFDDLASLSIPSSPVASIASLKLIDADSGVILGDLTDGQVIDARPFPNRRLAVVATTSGSGKVGSVRFDFDGVKRFKIENAAPYSLFGDTSRGKPRGRVLKGGKHTLTVRAYAQSGAAGTAGSVRTVNFRLLT